MKHVFWLLSLVLLVQATTTAKETAYPGEMILVPAGTFEMGPDAQDESISPKHTVSLSNDYFLSKTEVTNGEYCAALNWALEQGLVTVTKLRVEAFGQELLNLDDFRDCEIAYNEASGRFEPIALDFVGSGTFEYGPGLAYPDGYDAASHPVKAVSWYGAACYTDWLCMMEGLEPFYNGNWNPSVSHNPYNHTGYRLPTEAEWEHAARYPDGRFYPWGDESPSPCKQANYSSCIKWTSPVGSYPAGNSALGFVDMAGNVWEWVNDWANITSAGAVTDPFGPETGGSRFKRGGDWFDIYNKLTTTCRSGAEPHLSGNAVGFRVLKK
jgi:formylglycine-generating enzyme required for sulfatase activity